MIDYFLRFEQLWLLYLLLPLLVVVLILKKYGKSAYYRYPLASYLAKHSSRAAPTHKKIFFLLRFITLSLLLFLIVKPQLVDRRSNVIMDGIDIVIALDVSGSMQFQDYDDDQRSRFDVAKQEALRFIHLRTDDSIGLVIFGKDALSRIPLTLDKKMLDSALQELKLGIIDPDGTVLATALVTAANRLRHSQAKSKIIILLTDGEPSQNDCDPAMALELAKKLGIKIYTIGIGTDEDQVFMHPFYGLVPKPKINRALLSKIAQETGGTFFLARNSADMRSVYDTIDALEKTKHETPIYHKYYDIFIPIVWVIILIVVAELLLSATLWFGI